MEINELKIRGAGLNYNEIPAIHQKRTLAFVNNFITNTVTIMNKLAHTCETKLQAIEIKMQKMDACLRIIEAKLDSIPGLENISINDNQLNITENTSDKKETIENANTSETLIQETKGEESLEVKNTAKNDHRYANYFKMLHVGVPLQAVKLKVKQDGLDPNVLDNPDTHIPLNTMEKSSSSSSDTE